MSIAAAIFDGDELAQAIGVPVYYGFVEAIVVSMYCVWAWKNGWTKAPTDITLWKALTTSYEVLALDEAAEQLAAGIQLPPTTDKTTKSADGGGWDYVDYGDAGANEPKSGFVDYEATKKAKETGNSTAESEQKDASTGGWFTGFL